MIGSGAESGYVQAWKTNICGSSDISNKYITVISDDYLTKPLVKILPNPAVYEIYISYSSQESEDQESFTQLREYIIIDFHGKTIFKYKSKQTNLKLDLRQIKYNGVYVLNIKNGNTPIFRHRFIISR